MNKILFLEDDPDQAESINADLRKIFPEADIITCFTESDLLETINGISPGELHFALLDAMVPWCFPSEYMPIPPEDVQMEGTRYAGRRCLAAIRKRFGQDLLVVIYSVLTSDGHGVQPSERTRVLEKNPENGDLLTLLKSNL